jgi:hypothetical protein
MNKIKNKFKELLQQKGDESLLDAKYMGISFDDIQECYYELGLDLPFKLIENTWLTRYPNESIGHGWGNGYVRIAEGHKYHGNTYDDIDVSVHGGLTFSEHITNNDKWSDGFWVGFDTAHSGDNLQKWPVDRVLEETMSLFKQIYGLS